MLKKWWTSYKLDIMQKRMTQTFPLSFSLQIKCFLSWFLTTWGAHRGWIESEEMCCYTFKTILHEVSLKLHTNSFWWQYHDEAESISLLWSTIQNYKTPVDFINDIEKWQNQWEYGQIPRNSNFLCSTCHKHLSRMMRFF